MENVGETLKEHRVTRELSQIQLAQATGIKQQNISRWENNIHLPDIAECIILADFYDITLDELVGRDYVREKYSK